MDQTIKKSTKTGTSMWSKWWEEGQFQGRRHCLDLPLGESVVCLMYQKLSKRAPLLIECN
jgi:hypothetical protein